MNWENIPYFAPLNQRVIKIIIWTLTIVLGAMVLTSVGFYLMQDYFIFQRKHLAKNYSFEFQQDFSEYSIPTDKEDTLNALLFPAPSPSRGLILYFHGNEGNLQRWGQYAIDFTSLGYDVLMIDYRGYGKSTGTPSEEKLYRDAATVWNWSQSNVPTPRIIIYGRSLGSGVASQLATLHTPDLLILETPFDELTGTLYAPLRPLLTLLPLHAEFPNNTFIVKVTCPIVIFHGTDDWVVPLESAMNLKPLLKKDDKFIIIEGGGHRNLRDFESFHKALAKALE